MENQSLTENRIDEKCIVLGMEESLKKSKEKMIKTRIADIKDSIGKSNSKRKIELLALKLQEAQVRTKQDFGELVKVEDIIWLDGLDFFVDNCLADAAEYCEDKENMISNKADFVSTQLKRIEIPTFYGNKENYFHWKSAFRSCRDSASVSDEIKLLHLHRYLGGIALQSVKGLGHSKEAYKLAPKKIILEDKYGGERRRTK